MKQYINNKILFTLIIGLIALFPSGCKLEDSVDPNNPSLDGVLTDASISELNNIVTGSESGMRDAIEYYLDDVGVVGREMYRFAGSEPRYTQDLLGQENATLDNNAFYTTRQWNASYRVIKNCNILLASIDNTQVPTAAQKEGYRAFANTIKAYEFLIALNLTGANGIRIDVADPDNLGPIVSYDDALTAIAALLNDASTQLDNAGDSFAFSLSNGFISIKPSPTAPLTPADFKKFNKALAARVAVYRKDFAGALNYLNESFFDINGDFQKGVFHVFSTASGDQLNRFFLAPNATGEVRVAQPDFRDDAIAAGQNADTRLLKISKRNATASQGGLSSDYDVAVYKSNTSAVPIIRNEELILIYAEAKIGTNALPEAVTAINRIRSGNNLTPYAGAVSQAALTTEMLNQRRYSLFCEGHRWVDMRRYDKLGELPIDRTGDDVWPAFPIPFAENVGQ
ncbi:RagB/SusD family nutrient uptake outer membrane protein [Solitalea sp. MAHUQ-68]|uniref:RagB/SusD family nutrient uptake outer membrane protein n=1 Tax=Solitalea agri TaxID=2953739 RepID=A0A9X2JCV6_9SPHI|nr:RagB/SusD family nutrient uptake outer membrane protein [Solitalea agri]MCO4293483.1 RagB/SusD family nutrient uptake outer membrane protein [Solitalea agri]